MIFKIYGERNSGTMYLEKLLKANNFDVYVDSKVQNTVIDWKHSYPTKAHPQIVYVFVFRELESWLVSTFHNHQHLRPFADFAEFLEAPQHSIETRINENGDILNHEDEGSTIFDIRYLKARKYLDFCADHKDTVAISLQYLQDKPLTFIRMLAARYDVKLPKDQRFYFRHMKTNAIEHNTKYDLDIGPHRPMIKKYIDENIEAWINNLNCICT